jgi:hypothetical protein
MIKELIERLNNEAIKQTVYIEEQIELANFLKNWSIVGTGLNRQIHRWHETSITVLKHPDLDEYVGIESITVMFDESADYSDFYHFYKFYEMQPTQHITYTIID